MSQIIAILNQKGGVGKTTTAINLGAYLAKSGKTVLLVDADPQGNTTSGLGIDKHNLGAALKDVLFGTVDLASSVINTNISNLMLVPSNAGLAEAEVEMVPLNNREFLLKSGLANSSHDFVIIDCPPALGLLAVNALTAANQVLIPVQTEYYAMEGLSQLLSVVQEVKQGLNPDLKLMGVVLTMYDSRTTLSEQVRQEIAKHFGDKLFNTIIPRNIRLAEAPSFGKSIIEHDKWSKGARAYKQLAKEVTERAKY